ncbi:MoxR family ATPase [Paraflavitalea sp. CAU 1676]|uniref:AAA family ATPase n=1 Tax=Paraflavitalea sp. CAU 1676 TaxID=3032598 RepID=UPI0023DAEB0F|nr:MoxR family ATPase [Paraflavitalea sp. CAU 1676]MDF2191581.1 MoxR family ATPase [Paraflavitalea sp. CAU 1676]
MATRDQILELKKQIGENIIGQEDVITKILIGLLTDGNVLLEGLPGLAKTRAVKSLAKHLACKLSRIQFTPDLLPSDITGTEIYQPQSEEKFIFQPGPLFSNLVLADEINRAPAKVQAALLEAMEERQVSVAGKTHAMEPLFMVLATENPIEQEGTYPLPEAQLDRFMMKIEVTYPGYDDELSIMRLVRKEAGSTNGAAPVVIPQEVIFEARKAINTVKTSEAAEKYIVDIISATRYPDKFGKDLAKWISYGASPRGTIALDKCSRVVAWLEGRDYVTPDDIRFIAHDVLRHRIILSYTANADGMNANKVIDELLKNVAVS